MGSLPPYRRGSGGSLVPAVGGEESTRITNLANLQNELRGIDQKVQAYLVVVAGPGLGEMHRLEGQESVIGRSANVNVRLTDDGISRRHCRVVMAGDSVVLEDLGSANGTTVNGEPIQRRELKEGDKVRLGTTVLKFTYQDKLDESFQKQMYDAALRDGLTKAFNKKFFLDRLQIEFSFAKRHKTPLSLILFDVDHFKRVNDTYGHLAGDAVLVQLAALAQSMLRTEDIAARYGGEEFAVLCRGVPMQAGLMVAERIRSSVERAEFIHDGQRLPVMISAGVAGLPDVSADVPAGLVSAADEALYEAKRSGRNRVCVKR